MNGQARRQMESEIKTAQTAKDLFDVVFKYYDFESATPGNIAKGIFATQIANVANILSVKEKPQYK